MFNYHISGVMKHIRDVRRTIQQIYDPKYVLSSPTCTMVCGWCFYNVNGEGIIQA